MEAWNIVKEYAYEYGGNSDGILIGSVDQVETYLRGLAFEEGKRHYLDKYVLGQISVERTEKTEVSVYLKTGEVSGTRWTGCLFPVVELVG